MVILQETVRVDAPCDKLFTAMRDHFEKYLSALPGVTSARALETQDYDSEHRRTITEWKMVPRFARGNSAEPGRWKIFCLWATADRSCEWRMETLFEGEFQNAFGSVRYDEDEFLGGALLSLNAMFEPTLPDEEAETRAEEYVAGAILNLDFLLNAKVMKSLVCK